MSQALQRRKSWSWQPPYPAAVDKANALARGHLVGVIPAVSRAEWSPFGTPAIEAAAATRFLALGSSAYLTRSRAVLAGIGNACSWVWVGRWISGTGFLVGDVQISGSGYNAGIYVATGNKPTFYVRTGSALNAGSATALISGADVVIVGTYDGANIRIYVDGMLKATTAQTGTVSSSSGNTLALNRWNFGSPSQQCAAAHVFSRALSDAEVRAISANPWRIYRASGATLFIPAAGGGITGTLAAGESGADTVVASGQVALSATLAALESGADVAGGGGAVLVAGTLTASESGADTAVIVSSSMLSGAMSANEDGADIAAASGAVAVHGAFAITESGADAFALSGQIRLAGILAASESGTDTALFRSTEAVAVLAAARMRGVIHGMTRNPPPAGRRPVQRSNSRRTS